VEQDMTIRWVISVVAVLAFSGSATPARVAAAAPIACDAVAHVPLTSGTVTSAQPVQAGAFTPPTATNPSAANAFATLPAFCRVTARLTPTPDSDIRVEVWLPLSGWNGKMQAVGNGGLGGTIPYPALAAAVRAGYAAAGTDTGHVGGNGDFVAGHPEKLVDFAYRAIHEMTVSAKAVVTAHYDARPSRSYFNACSTGGRQGLIEAQRYPEDFDGIVAGDPSWDQMRLYAARVALNVFENREPAAVIPPGKYAMMHDAVLAVCDAADGVKDGVIEDPARCSFDFATLTCEGADRADCLTPPQVESAKAMASPIADHRSGSVLYPGRYYPGSELGWGGVAGPAPSGESLEGMKKIVFNPAWDYHTIRVPDDVERAVKADRGLLYGGDANLTRFFQHGGKLLMYHGWADPLVSPDASLLMYRRINDAVGSLATSSLALFMVPGMGHCQGGAGTDTFDKIAALDRWVETGTKPESVPASHMTGSVVNRTRPLCAYPAFARYTGSGSTDDAGNFRCELTIPAKQPQADAPEGRNGSGAPPEESAPSVPSTGTRSLRPSARASRLP
jgi:feruloyl esterase